MKNDMPEAKAASPIYRDYIKRIIDLLIAVPVLLIAAIPMAIIAAAVKLDSPGPALFKQDRLGKDGKVFLATWLSGEMSFSLSPTAGLSEEETLKIIESIK